MEAAHDDYAETAGLLIDNGADINAECDTGKTALMYAKENGHTEIVNY